MQFRDFKILAVLLISIVNTLQIEAQVVAGKIVNEENEPVPYVTIFVPETREGTISNTEGKFKIKLPRGKYNFTIRSLGYLQTNKEVIVNQDSLNLDITLKKQSYQIKEVKIFPGKEDPAWFIMRKAIAKAPYYRSKIKHYQADLYIKSNFAFSNIPRVYQNKIEIEGRKLKELIKENVTYVIESQNQITFDYPNRYEQKVISKKTSLVGLEEPPIIELMSSSFYDERPNQIISPLSSLAINHYDFKYEGFITVGNYDVFKIRVTPNRKSDELVEGHIYIVDKLWCIYYLELNGRFEFFEYTIKQQFENLGNNNWLPVSNNIDGNVSMLGLKGQFYYGVALKYNEVEENDFGEIDTDIKEEEQLSESTRVPGEKEKKLRAERNVLIAQEELSNREVKKAARLNRKILKEQYQDTILNNVFRTNYQVKEIKDTLSNDYEYWDTIRAIPLTPAEMESYAMTDSLIRMELYKTDSLAKKKTIKKKTLTKKILFGDWDLAKDSVLRLSYDGLFSFKNFDFNAVDGYKYRQKFDLSFKLDSGQRLTINPEIGYAFNRNAIFVSVKGSFKDIFWTKGTVDIGFGKESRDFKTEPPGIQPILNAASSWFLAENYMRLYETTFAELGISHRLTDKITLLSNLYYDQFNPLKNNAGYLLSSKKDFKPNLPSGFTEESPEIIAQNSFSYKVGINYYKRQRKPWLEESPFIFIKDYYNFRLEFRQGVKDVFSSVSDFSQIHFAYHQQANISPSAGIDLRANLGYFFHSNQMHFSQFQHFRTNEIPLLLNFFTHSFQNVNDYELSTNKSYINLGGEIRTEYILLRYLSFINTNTWSESFHVNYLTTPDFKHYWETGYSLNSLLFIGNIGVFTGFKGSKFESVMFKITLSGY